MLTVDLCRVKRGSHAGRKAGWLAHFILGQIYGYGLQVNASPANTIRHGLQSGCHLLSWRFVYSKADTTEEARIDLLLFVEYLSRRFPFLIQFCYARGLIPFVSSGLMWKTFRLGKWLRYCSLAYSRTINAHLVYREDPSPLGKLCFNSETVA